MNARTFGRVWCRSVPHAVAGPGDGPRLRNGAGAGAPPAGTPQQPVAVKCDLANRTFRQTSPGPCGSSDWRFVFQADGSWQATESGCANATGIARYDGTAVNLEVQYSGGAGRYIWPLDGQCRGLTGTVTWTQGPLTGQTVASTLALVQ